MTFEPLTKEKVLNSDWLYCPDCDAGFKNSGLVIDQIDVLCALKGLQKEIMDNNVLEPENKRLFVILLSEWFPILQSETLKTTDDGNAHLPQSNQTEDVRTSESLVGGSEQTSTYNCSICKKITGNYPFCSMECKFSFSQPSIKTVNDGGVLYDGTKNECGDAGELSEFCQPEVSLPAPLGEQTEKTLGESPDCKRKFIDSMLAEISRRKKVGGRT